VIAQCRVVVSLVTVPVPAHRDDVSLAGIVITMSCRIVALHGDAVTA